MVMFKWDFSGLFVGQCYYVLNFSKHFQKDLSLYSKKISQQENVLMINSYTYKCDWKTKKVKHITDFVKHKSVIPHATIIIVQQNSYTFEVNIKCSKIFTLLFKVLANNSCLYLKRDVNLWQVLIKWRGFKIVNK